MALPAYALTWAVLLPFLRLPSGSSGVKFYGSVFERQSPGQCGSASGNSPLDAPASLSECALECEGRHCLRFLYCSETNTCAIHTDVVNTTGCFCHVKKKRCHNGGTLNNNEDCECLMGYHGTECEHIVRDCTEGKQLGLGSDDKVTWIRPHPTGPPFQVMCDFQYGFTYIQRRQRNSQYSGPDFNRTWAEYRSGFGDLGCNHWLGLDSIHRLTATGTFSLEVNVDYYSSWGQGFYCPFSVDGPETGYTVHLNAFTTPENGLSDSLHAPGGRNVDGKPFSTFDHDALGTGCAQRLGGGFWYDENCTAGSLNGPFVTPDELAADRAVPRMSWGGDIAHLALQHVLLRVQRTDQC